MLFSFLPRGCFGGKGGGEEIKEGLAQNRLDYQQLVWEMNMSCLSYFLSAQQNIAYQMPRGRREEVKLFCLFCMPEL